MVETILHGNWMKDLGIFILSENLFMKCYGGEGYNNGFLICEGLIWKRRD